MAAAVVYCLIIQYTQGYFDTDHWFMVPMRHCWTYHTCHSCRQQSCCQFLLFLWINTFGYT